MGIQRSNFQVMARPIWITRLSSQASRTRQHPGSGLPRSSCPGILRPLPLPLHHHLLVPRKIRQVLHRVHRRQILQTLQRWSQLAPPPPLYLNQELLLIPYFLLHHPWTPLAVSTKYDTLVIEKNCTARRRGSS